LTNHDKVELLRLQVGFLPAQPRAWRISPRLLWCAPSLLLAGFVTVPMVIVLAAWLNPEQEVWRHLADTVLVDLLRNTTVLMIGVGIGVLLLGVSLAWLTAMCDFPGRRLFDWALMLPLAVPAYVLAFVAVGTLDYSGPVQSWLRAQFGLQGNWFPSIRSEGGVITLMTLALYPYVYMLVRAAFLSQGRRLIDAARVLGFGPWAVFWRVALPMARPAIAAGVSLSLMETLADFGAVSVFNYDTFTTAIYKAWYGFFSLHAAAQLASLLLLFVALALIGERSLRRKLRYHGFARVNSERRLALTGWRGICATVFATTVLMLAFLLPLVQLSIWAWQTALKYLDARYMELLLPTLSLGVLAALLTVAGAFLLGYTERHHGGPLIRAAVRTATLGYALPGSVLAVGIMLSFVWLDQQVFSVVQGWFGISAGLGLAGTLPTLLSAYLVRFLAVAFGPVDSGLARIKPSLPEAARSLGAGQWEILGRIYLPMLRPGLLTASLLVMVEVMKEMPATLLLRPFGWDTVAVRIFEMTSEGEWERAALPAITLVVVGLIPAVLLIRRSASSR
jgi:ABC-type Fe3+ transport system, permease component